MYMLVSANMYIMLAPIKTVISQLWYFGCNHRQLKLSYYVVLFSIIVVLSEWCNEFGKWLFQLSYLLMAYVSLYISNIINTANITNEVENVVL